MVDPTGFAASRFAGFGNDIYTTTNYGFTNRSSKGNDVSTTQTYRKKREGRYGNDNQTTPDNYSLKYLAAKYGVPKDEDGQYSLVEIMKARAKIEGPDGAIFIQVEASGQALGFIGGTASVQYVRDFKGNWAIQASTGGGAGIGGSPGDGIGINYGGGLSGSVGLNIGYADVNNVFDMEGWGLETGVGVANGLGGTATYIRGLKGNTLEEAIQNNEVTYVGGSVGVVFGTPGAEVHTWTTYTWTLTSGNTFDGWITKPLTEWIEYKYYYQ